MRTLRVALPAVVLVAVAATPGRWAAPVPEARPTFRVATYNIHKGASRQGPYDLERTIDAISRFDADLVGVQEAMRNQMGANCDDQPALIAEGLRRRTRRPWTYVYEKAWISENRQCVERGHGDGVETEGLAFFAAERIASSRFTRLPEERVGLAVRVASLPHVPIIVTHLAPNRQNQAQRVHQIAALLPWAKQHGPGILVGDLNAEPTASELAPLLGRYRDGWAEAAARGTTRGVASGSTRPNRVSRIDYVLYAPEIGLTLESVEVIDTSTLGLGEVSDHNPVVATFRRK
jgi:endonuclease/exonuclease/phosphatase family metal-dependent hydrolase